MLYWLFYQYLHKLGVPGTGVFQYISFRASMAAVLSLLLCLFLGKRIIRWLQKQQIGETIRDLGLEGQMQKKGTPTMGGIIILIAIIVPTLLFAKLNNPYVILMVLSTLWMGVIGIIDDYIKVFKKDKEGLKSWFKVLGQLVLGAIIAVTIDYNHHSHSLPLETNVPFLKEPFNYSSVFGEGNAWWIFLPLIIFIVVAVTNAVNLTDGIDGLASGTTAIVGTCISFTYPTAVKWLFSSARSLALASVSCGTMASRPRFSWEIRVVWRWAARWRLLPSSSRWSCLYPFSAASISRKASAWCCR
jgi:phospho-N-acetylmuramoyl-pentapeptide-transferase